MAACDTGFVELPDGMSKEEAIRKYSAHKRWVDQYAKKVNKLMSLLEKQYDSRADTKVEAYLSKAENEIAAISQITEFLKQKGYERYKDHLDEVERLQREMEAAWEAYNNATFSRAAASPAAATPARSRPPPPPDSQGHIKLVAELKPDSLSHDSSAAELRIWMKKFEAYYVESNMSNSRIKIQHAYLMCCMDKQLSLQLDGMIEAQTPVLGQNSCMSRLTDIFKKKYPLLLRRRQFFQLQQQPGQDEREFMELLKAAASEADIEGMSVQDAICLVCVTGLKDNRLREKLSELEEPSLPSFDALVDAYMHARATAGPASANRTAGQQQQQQQQRKKNQNNNRISEQEKKRRSIMKGKCFRCGSSEHMANTCNVAKDVKCRKCNSVGHIAAACASGQARSSDEVQSVQQSGNLAIEYQGEARGASYAQDGAYAQANVAFARYVGSNNNSHPTPPALL